jgi:16S rRNA (cytosine967-C5)-methyltransferase
VNNKKNARDAAYSALRTCAKEEGFLQDSINAWAKEEGPSSRDIAFAYELAYGVERRKLTLDYIAEGLASKGKLKLKLKERVLVRMALYQYFFMDKVPTFAIANEMLELAKKHCHSNFSKFLNALMRNLPEALPNLPSSNNVEDLSIMYSYPQYYIQSLLEVYGTEKATELLQLGNKPGATFIRLRPGTATPKGCETYPKNIPPMAVLKNRKNLESISQSSEYYIQNITSAHLIKELSKHTKSPERILDLCAAPGGKILATYDLFPNATYHANDISEKKLALLESNFKKYDVNIHLHTSLGQDFTSEEQFDVVIIDAPCSNTGVLNKRPEARWRLDSKSILECIEMQKSLIKNSIQLLKDGGQIWYMTCSILKTENEELVKEVCQEHGLNAKFSKTILPTADGWDGGFAAILCRD